MYPNTVVVIPARLGSTRLTNKPLEKIGNLTMIERVWRQVMKTKLSNIYVATDSNIIADIIEQAGGKYIITSQDCLTGTDRVYQAAMKLSNASSIEYVINVQGDMPFIDPETILTLAKALQNTACDVVTPVAKVNREIASSFSTVKVVTNFLNQALYFSRQPIPFNAEEFLYHIGIYGYTIKALEKFVKNLPTQAEKLESIEILRALHIGLQVEVCSAKSKSLSVDTIHDLAAAIAYYVEHDASV